MWPQIQEAFDRRFLKAAKYNVASILLDQQKTFYKALVPSIRLMLFSWHCDSVTESVWVSYFLFLGFFRIDFSFLVRAVRLTAHISQKLGGNISPSKHGCGMRRTGWWVMGQLRVWLGQAVWIVLVAWFLATWHVHISHRIDIAHSITVKWNSIKSNN